MTGTAATVTAEGKKETQVCTCLSKNNLNNTAAALSTVIPLQV